MHISELATWKLQLGLLPVPLFRDRDSVQKYVLLNGRYGNFCLDLEGDSEEATFRNHAWSSDVGHYVNILRDQVEIHRWDRKGALLERYSTKSVESNLSKFYEYLQKDQPRRDISIISFATNIFRRLRASIISQSADGADALKAFLFLLACATDSASREAVDLGRWHLDETAKNTALMIREGDWQELVDELTAGLPLYGLKPDISLLLRHASGPLFQEAHYIASAPNQMSFEGFLPRKASVGKFTDSIGVHYTPSPIVRTLVEEAIASLGELPCVITVFDPACGSSEFLKELLRQLSLLNYSGKIVLKGWDLSPSAVDISKFVLGKELDSWTDRITIDIALKDALDIHSTWPKDIDIILMNPPFLSWQNMSDIQKETAKNILGELLEKRPDQASLFVLKAVHALKEQGIIATILPASILDAESYKKYRSSLSEFVSPCLIGKLGNQSLFANAQVDAALYVGRRTKDKSESVLALWADHKTESASAVLRALRQHRSSKNRIYTTINERGYSIYTHSTIGGAMGSWAPRSYDAYKLSIDLIQYPRVKELFKILQGARTGLKPAFVIKKSTLLTLPRKEQMFFRPAVVNESISAGHLNDSVYVFFPYGEHIPHIDSENALEKYLPHYYRKHLIQYRDELANRARKSEKNWWKLSEHRAWQEAKFPKLVSTFFGKAGSFAWDNEGDFVVVQGHCWNPKPSSHISTMRREIGLAYLAILCSPITNILLSFVSNHLGGGQWDLSQKCLQNMPIPNLFNKELDPDLLDQLSQIGDLISQSMTYDNDELHQLVLSLYGLPESTTIY